VLPNAGDHAACLCAHVCIAEVRRHIWKAVHPLNPQVVIDLGNLPDFVVSV